MRSVGIASANALAPESRWDLSLAELALDAAAPVARGQKIDSVFVAGWPSSLVQGQADFAAIVADRLGLHARVSLTLDAGDISGAAALYAAWIHVASGQCDSALVVGAGKVSDLGEGERLDLMDCVLDRDAEAASGLSFSAQAGLLASRYCDARKKDSRVFAEVSAANLSAWARRSGGTGVTGADLKADLIVAPPLARTDFPQMLDGSCAVLLQAGGREHKAHIEGFAGATDTVAIWERRDPLRLVAVAESASGVMKGRRPPRWIEIDAASSVIQQLAMDALELGSTDYVVNRFGGTHGRGRVPGASPLYQVCDVLAEGAPSEEVLLVAVAGLGSRAFAAHISPGLGP